MDQKELELLKKTKEGDAKAFDELVKMHDRQILQVLYGMLGNMQDAEDVYQETFMKVYTKIKSFRFESEFKTWVTKIAMNLAINKIRQRKLKQVFSINQRQEDLDNWDLPEPDGLATASDKMTYSHETMEKITYSLDQLSTQQRSVFVLKHIHGYKISEIANMLKVAEGTIKNQLFRATQKLQKSLKTYYRESLV